MRGLMEFIVAACCLLMMLVMLFFAGYDEGIDMVLVQLDHQTLEQYCSLQDASNELCSKFDGRGMAR